MRKQSLRELNILCTQFRIELIDMLFQAQAGHPGGSLSACEILTYLYYNEMNIDPTNPQWEERDRFVLSKGHAAPMLYIILAHLGFFPLEELPYLRKLGSLLQGHPQAGTIPGIDVSTGSLGLGLSAACGMAAAAKVLKKPYRTYVLVGDGELQEGATWEALLSASKFGLHNLTIIVDNNKVQLDGVTEDVMPLGDLTAKLKAFSMHTLTVNGNDVAQLEQAFAAARQNTQQPTVIIANTVKGKGVDFMEGKSQWHRALLTPEHHTRAMAQLKGGSI